MDKIRLDTANRYRAIRRILRSDNTPDEHNNNSRWLRWLLYGGIFTAIIYLLLIGGCAYSYTLDNYADAIHKAEGNDNYGILVHYKYTTYRQACINTIKHQHRLWVKSGRKQAFIAFLSASYAPIGASNDSNNLNVNWQRNVTYWLRKGA